MGMPVGVTLPNYGPFASAGNLARLARRAEELGFDAVWVADHLIVPCDTGSIYPYDQRAEPEPARLDRLVEFYEPLITLAYVAALTTRIRLGVSVYVMPYRNPVVTAKLVATLDALSGGRVLFGAGVGWLREEFVALGADPRVRGRVTDEYLEVCRRLWRDEVAQFDGRHYSLPPVRSGPKPVQRPWPPIWVGGNSEAALARAVALGDGWHVIDLAPTAIAPGARRLAEQLRAAGRPRDGFTLSMRVSGPVSAAQRDAYGKAGVEYLLLGSPRANAVDELEADMARNAAALLERR